MVMISAGIVVPCYYSDWELSMEVAHKSDYFLVENRLMRHQADCACMTVLRFCIMISIALFFLKKNCIYFSLSPIECTFIDYK